MIVCDVHKYSLVCHLLECSVHESFRCDLHCLAHGFRVFGLQRVDASAERVEVTSLAVIRALVFRSGKDLSDQVEIKSRINPGHCNYELVCNIHGYLQEGSTRELFGHRFRLGHFDTVVDVVEVLVRVQNLYVGNPYAEVLKYHVTV